MKKYKSILVISDTHFPYHHPDTIDFLRKIKAKYKPDNVVHIGDEIDGQSISMHDHSPELMAPADEFAAAIKKLQPLYKLFPNVDVLESNHGSLVYRRGEKFGIPRHVLKSYGAMIEAPKGWRWHYDLVLTCSNGEQVYFHHARSSNALRASQQMGTNVVFGHHHNKFSIEHWTSGIVKKWGMFVGCLIDIKSLAYAYGRNNLTQPILGCGVILEGQARLIPLNVDKNGRWDGKVN